SACAPPSRRLLPPLDFWVPLLPPAPPRRLPVTCLGAGNGKPEGARRVEFTMGLFGKTQEKPPKELVPLSPPVRSLPLDGGAGGRVFKETAVARESPSTSVLHKGAEGRTEFLLLSTGRRGSNAILAPEHPVPGARWYVPPEPFLAQAPPSCLAYGPPTGLGSLPENPASSARRAAMGVSYQHGPVILDEDVNEWSLKIRKEMRVVDRQIRDIQREEEKVKRSVKDAAKKGQKDVCVVLAKEMIRSRRAVSKLYASKAHMNSVLMGMKNQLAVLRVAGSLQKSTEVMKAMQSLVRIPEIQATMRELSKEMMKAGIIEEMLEDTFESMDDQEEMEEAAEMEIDKILFEITAGALGKAPSKVTDALPEPEPPGAMAASEDEEEEEEALEAMQSRLATLRS
ncbi:hypothetical protein MC885_000110, partial [Smutsia gigantea]